ncbi:YfaP family protein, partial [Pseudomonas chlororaphis]|uniref:YfaP family protein n=1 Tax=Pseudomonas chlororaphis TaxID=587753 RepID=UPI003D125BB2
TNAQGQVTLTTDFADDPSNLLIIKKPGYSNLVVKCPCSGMTYAISPVMQNLDGLRVVLTWGATPSDLDSHMIFPGNNIYFRNQQGEDAHLDVDDIDGYGPETITLEKKHYGESYVYAVHDYSNQTRPESRQLAASQAKVFVYMGQSLVRTYYVPQDRSGNLWTVFRMTGNGDFHFVIEQRRHFVQHVLRIDGHAAEGVDVLEVAIAGHAEHGPQVTAAVLRHVVGAHQRLPHVHEHLGLAGGKLTGLRTGL